MARTSWNVIPTKAIAATAAITDHAITWFADSPCLAEIGGLIAVTCSVQAEPFQYRH